MEGNTEKKMKSWSRKNQGLTDVAEKKRLKTSQTIQKMGWFRKLMEVPQKWMVYFQENPIEMI